MMRSSATLFLITSLIFIWIQAPLNTICKTPAFMAHTAAVGKCLTKLKMKSLSEGDPVCIYNCLYLDNKWALATGALDFKKITADFSKAMDKTWGPIFAAAMKVCTTETTKHLTAKLQSGYKTTCKAGSYMFQTCAMTQLISACPAALQSTSFKAGKSALVACDPFALTKSAADLAKSAAGALKTIDPKSAMAALKGQDSKTLLAKLPPGMAAMIPAGVDVSKMDPSKLNPALLAKLPAGFNLGMFGGR